MSAFHAITMASITGDQVSFEQFRGQVCLVVNVASA
jgi:glutathione peroxidase-family protein